MTTERRYPALDGLRFFCCMAVIVGHALNDRAVQTAAPHVVAVWVHGLARLGVEIFFALSGFLITGILLRRPSLKAFYIRRTLRIWPVYYVAVAAGLALVALVQLRPALGSAVLYSPSPGAWTRGLVASLLFVRNWVSVPQPSPPGVLWSLCVEEQFYLVFPVLVLAFRSAVPPALLWAVAAVVSRYLMVRHGVDPGMIYANTLAHGDCLMWGALAAQLRMSGPGASRWAVPAACAALALPLAYVDVPSSMWQWQWTYAISGPMTAAVVYAWSFVDRCPEVLRKLGALTYAAYVVHVYAIVAVWKLPPSARVVAASVLTFAVAWASGRWLERPFLRLKDRVAY